VCPRTRCRRPTGGRRAAAASRPGDGQGRYDAPCDGGGVSREGTERAREFQEGGADKDAETTESRAYLFSLKFSLC
jgi:hypothetical protein